MVLWNDELGGTYPWDGRYYGVSAYGEFDPACKFQTKIFLLGFFAYLITVSILTSTQSLLLQVLCNTRASTAGCMATGHKATVNMMSVDLYEEKASIPVEDAMICDKSGDVITSVPVWTICLISAMVYKRSSIGSKQMVVGKRMLLCDCGPWPLPHSP